LNLTKSFLSVLAITGILCGDPIAPEHVDSFSGHPRLIVISDIGNEPDDQMSLVRLLLYSNEIDIEGLVASTSTWQKTKVHPETMRTLIKAYGEVRTNLLKHAWLADRGRIGEPCLYGADRLRHGGHRLRQDV